MCYHVSTLLKLVQFFNTTVLSVENYCNIHYVPFFSLEDMIQEQQYSPQRVTFIYLLSGPLFELQLSTQWSQWSFTCTIIHAKDYIQEFQVLLYPFNYSSLLISHRNHWRWFVEHNLRSWKECIRKITILRYISKLQYKDVMLGSFFA